MDDSDQFWGIAKSLEKSRRFYVVRIDMDGRYTFVNHAFTEKFQNASNEFVGQHTHHSIHSEDHQEYSSAIDECVANPGTPVAATLRQPHPDGIFFYTDWEFTALAGEKGNCNEVLGIGYNISDYVYKQAKLKTTASKLNDSLEKLQFSNASLSKANAHLDKLVHIISHDLRSPIASSLGLIEIMLKQESITKLRHLLNIQENSLQKLDGFILDILDYSKNNRKLVASKPVDWLAKISNAVTPYKESNKVHIETEIVSDSIFTSDTMRLNIMFSHLLSNAVKFSKPGQEDLSIFISIKSDAKEAIIEVRDNGLGIPEEHITQIFDIFFRGHEQIEGSGLGLYIVKEVVDKLRGSISVKSSVGVGSSFTVHLPNTEVV